MDQVAPLAGALSSYGLYAIVAVLVVAVVYLFRQVNQLHAQIQQILIDTAKTATDMTTKVTIALEQSTKTIERIEAYFLRNKEG